MDIKGHWSPSGLEVEGEYKYHNSEFSHFFQLYYPYSNFNYPKNTIYIWCFGSQILSLTRHKGMLQAKDTTKVPFSSLLLNNGCIFFVLAETLVNGHSGHCLQLKISFFYSVLIMGQLFGDFDATESNS